MSAGDGIFPLPLTAWERYLLADDRPSHPMVIWAQLKFDRSPDRQRFRDAIADASRVHPLVRCVVRDDRDGPEWHLTPPGDVAVEQSPSSPGGNADGDPRAIDIRTRPGVRHWLDASDGGATWTMAVHHSVCDGIGIRQFAVDVLSRYAGRKRVSTRPRQLTHRGDFDRWFNTPPDQPLSVAEKLRAAYYFHVQTPAPIPPIDAASPVARDADHGGTGPTRDVLLHRRLDRSQSDDLMTRLGSSGLTLDELALASLFRTLDRCLAAAPPRTRIRITTPIDLRRGEDRYLSACNRMTYGFIGRTRGQIEADLAASIAAEKRWMRRTRIYLDFLAGLPFAVDRPRLLRWVLDRRRPMSSAVLTSTGDVLRGLSKIAPRGRRGIRFGDVELIGVHAAAPVRPGTPITLAVSRFGPDVDVTARWDARVWTRDQASRFVDHFVGDFTSRRSPPRDPS